MDSIRSTRSRRICISDMVHPFSSRKILKFFVHASCFRISSLKLVQLNKKKRVQLPTGQLQFEEDRRAAATAGRCNPSLYPFLSRHFAASTLFVAGTANGGFGSGLGSVLTWPAFM